MLLKYMGVYMSPFFPWPGERGSPASNELFSTVFSHVTALVLLTGMEIDLLCMLNMYLYFFI